MKENDRVCPVERAGLVDNRIRRWLQNPRKILRPFIVEGMTVLDLGCGPGFFSLDAAQMVGKSGKVIACDLQEGMLLKLRGKVQGTELEERITLHRCEENKLGVITKVDFILAIWMIHEVRDQGRLFNEIRSILKPGGKVLIIEPPFHVSKAAFEAMIERARDSGLGPVECPGMFLGKAVILQAR